MLRRWKETEPVRLYLYGMVGPVLALLTAVGALRGELVTVFAGVAGAILLPATEYARDRVTPTGRYPRDPRHQVRTIRKKH